MGVAIFFSLGILINEYISWSFALLAFLVFLFIVMALATQKRKFMATVFLSGSIILLGALFSKGQQTLPKDHIYHVAKYYRKKPVLIEGVIASDVERRNYFRGKKTTFTLQARRVQSPWGWKKKSGRILVNIFCEKHLDFGNYLLLEGKLHKPFEFSKGGKFSYREFLNRKSIKLILSVKKNGYVEIKESNKGNPVRALSLQVKHRLKAILSENFSKNENSIMQAVLLGDRYNIPKQIKELFQISGVAHILAISGLHLGVVAFLMFLVIKILPLPRRWHYFLTICFLVSYAFMTGGRPSVIRATIMAGVFLGSFIMERETESINTLAFAALIILLFNPLNLFDVGFQLSFVSVFAIISFYPKFIGLFSGFLRNHKSKGVNYCIQYFCVSLSAYLGVAGLIAYYFQIVTPVAMIVNLIVVPIISVIVALGMGLLLMGLVWPPLAFVFAVCIKVLLNIMVAFIFLCVKVPGAYFLLEPISRWCVFLYYFLLFLSLYGIKTFSKG